MTGAAVDAPLERSRFREFTSAVATIMVKELRSRFRGRRAFVVLTIYLAILALIAYGVYTVMGAQARSQEAGGAFGGFGGLNAANASASLGQAIFATLSMFQLLLVCFIAPAFTAGAISLEREKQTLDLLISTPMRPGAIVVGKLLAALAFILLMILAGIPLSALVFMYGGVTTGDLLRQLIVLLSAALGFGTIGLFFSAFVKRTQASTVLTYSAMLAFTIGTLLVFIFWTALANRDTSSPFSERRSAPEQLMWVNPAVAMADVVANTESVPGAFSSFVGQFGTGSSVVVTPATDLCGDGGCAVPPCPAGAICDGPGSRVPDRATAFGFNTRYDHFWPRFAATFALLSVLLTLISMRLVLPPGMRFVFRRRRGAREAGPRQVTGDGDPRIEEAEA
jgi:ABC-type transport system involved in multi-copper enzyme maturation permease subunit